jgi:hypothetical protein
MRDENPTDDPPPPGREEEHYDETLGNDAQSSRKKGQET